MARLVDASAVKADDVEPKLDSELVISCDVVEVSAFALIGLQEQEKVALIGLQEQGVNYSFWFCPLCALLCPLLNCPLFLPS